MKGEKKMAEKTVPETKMETSLVTREITRNPEQFVSPLVDIFETGDALNVVADLPGVEKDGLNVKVEDGILTIEGKATNVGRKNPKYQEYELVNFFRQFELSDAIDQEKIAAELKHGVLTLTLPKAERSKPKKIKVKVG